MPNMTTLEKIIQDLSNLDDAQLEQVSAIIQTLSTQSQPIPCDRKNIRQFIQQVRQKHPQRSIEDIDLTLRVERDAWDS
jgi:hypothetical protein